MLHGTSAQCPVSYRVALPLMCVLVQVMPGNRSLTFILGSDNSFFALSENSHLDLARPG
jgi:hypothetical protein